MPPPPSTRRDQPQRRATVTEAVARGDRIPREWARCRRTRGSARRTAHRRLRGSTPGPLSRRGRTDVEQQVHRGDDHVGQPDVGRTPDRAEAAVSVSTIASGIRTVIFVSTKLGCSTSLSSTTSSVRLTQCSRSCTKRRRGRGHVRLAVNHGADHLDRHGVPRHAERTAWDDEIHEHAVELSATGLSLADVALRIAPQTVANRIRHGGAPVHPRRGRTSRVHSEQGQR
jgi:hypothetical protein